jgi:pyruvate formate-lyase/glycerol dehydratase family glycyl radical enzyme
MSLTKAVLTPDAPHPLTDSPARPRIRELRDAMMSEPRVVSVEQALLTTDTYRAHPQEPTIVKRALSLANALEHLTITIDPRELIVGNRTAQVRAGVVSPEAGSSWVDREIETLPTRPQDRFRVNDETVDTFRTKIVPAWRGASLEDVIRKHSGAQIDEIDKVVKINQKDHAQGHICPNVNTWLAVGPSGLKAAAERALKCASGDAADFHRSVVIVMDAAQTFILRYRDMAQELAAGADTASVREDMGRVASVLDRIATGVPTTFHEALQSTWFLFVLLQAESNASSFSPGRLDRRLLPYYEHDITEGTLDIESALELVECLWLKFNSIVYLRNQNSAKYFAGFPIGFNIAIGGQDEVGNDVVNDVSYLFLAAQAHLGMPQPNLSVRLHHGTTEALLKEAIRVVSRGSGMPQFFNDESVVPALKGLGIPEAEARDYAIVGCVELTTQGNNLGWSDAAMFNLNKVLELTLFGGKDLLTGAMIGPDFGSLSDYGTYEDLEAAFAQTIDYFTERMIRACDKVDRAHADVLPSPFLSSVIDGCMESGVDVTRGGAIHNLSGIQMIQAASLADSLAALKMLVFEEKLISRGTMMAALEANFEGYAVEQALMQNRPPKYGNDDPYVDTLAAQWAEYFAAGLRAFTNARGGKYHTGMYTVSAHVPMGQNVGASPDGRKSREPLADGGLSPVYGRDMAGPTAVLNSVSRLKNALTSNGGLLNMKFLPEFFDNETNIDKFATFMRAFVDLEVPHIQFNVIRREDLMAAKADPDRYRGLTVRVAGYTAYFVELAGDLQDEIIARTTQSL